MWTRWLAVGALLLLGCRMSSPNLPSAVVVEVQAQQGWQDTGIAVRAGDEVRVQYLSGTWSPWAGGWYDALGSGGDPKCDCNALMGASHAALLGRVGESSAFLVGADYQWVAGESGTLYLGINDTRLADNSGALRVLVEIKR
ncbi:MAG: hypothetical protein OHK0052_18500 [Anaerolineales bacterium]